MNRYSKILVIGVLCLLGVAGFSFMTMYEDASEIASKYTATTNGSYIRKHVSVKNNAITNTSRTEQNDTAQSGVIMSAPPDTNVDSWISYIQSCRMSEIRKGIVLEALDTVKKGCIYHQLRAGMGTSTRCIVGGSCDGQQAVPVVAYDYATQAKYSVPDPLYLDCSFFVKHCYSIAGLEMVATTTADLYSGAEFSTITYNDLVPGDIAVRRSNNSGHTRVFVGRDSKGDTVWAELADHAHDAIVAVYSEDALSSGGYKFKRIGTLASDTTFEGSMGVPNTSASETAGTKTLEWNDGWEFAKSTMIHPATLNKYVPSNYNGHTVFLNPGHGDGTNLASETPNDPLGSLQNQYASRTTAGHTSGTSYTTSSGKTVKEAEYVLNVANSAKDKLLAKGYAVVMARETNVNNFENAARSVWANNVADVHVAIHIDAGTHGPGWYRPNDTQKTHANYARWSSQGEALGIALENACAATLGKSTYTSLKGVLSGYCYSSIPCAYIELYGVQSAGTADFADSHIEQAAQGIADGVDAYFK